MKTYLSKRKAIVALHEKGFTEDFELVGDNMLWIQEKIWLQREEFAIVECHSVAKYTGQPLRIFGVVSDKYWAKGILISHGTH